MKSVVTIAMFAAAVLIAPGRASAQDPEPPAPQAKVRAERTADQPAVRERRGNVRAPEQQAPERAPENRPAEKRASEGEGRQNRVPERAVERTARVPETAEAPTRRTVVAPDDAAAPRAVTNADAASNADDQGERRGAVRRPQGDRSGARSGDRAVPRSEAPRPPRTTVVRGYPYRYSPYYSRYYDPWGYGSFGLGYFYYSPWAWSQYGSSHYGYGGGGYYPGYGRGSSFDIGSVKLKVRQRDAEVWVDGYYAGSVDDFDGAFQALKLDSGAYRIEIRKPGFETLTFDVRVQPERTITFRGDMRPIP
jgi:hypothetical protein